METSQRRPVQCNRRRAGLGTIIDGVQLSCVFSTFISRPATHEPWTAAIAASASSTVAYETKPKPLLQPFSLSMVISARVTTCHQHSPRPTGRQGGEVSEETSAEMSRARRGERASAHPVFAKFMLQVLVVEFVVLAAAHLAHHKEVGARWPLGLRQCGVGARARVGRARVEVVRAHVGRLAGL
jgi:hypothetical protein